MVQCDVILAAIKIAWEHCPHCPQKERAPFLSLPVFSLLWAMWAIVFYIVHIAHKLPTTRADCPPRGQIAHHAGSLPTTPATISAIVHIAHNVHAHQLAALALSARGRWPLSSLPYS